MKVADFLFTTVSFYFGCSEPQQTQRSRCTNMPPEDIVYQFISKEELRQEHGRW